MLTEPQRAAFEYDRHALEAGEVWRMWTAHFVHFSTRHACVDLATLFALALCLERRCGWRATAGLLLCTPPLLSSALYLGVPDLTVYRGASGLCVEFGVMLGLILWSRNKVARIVLLGLAGVLLAKTLSEAIGMTTNLSGLTGDVRVAWQAHALGAILGCFGFAARRYFAVAGTARVLIQENRDVVAPTQLLA